MTNSTDETLTISKSNKEKMCGPIASTNSPVAVVHALVSHVTLCSFLCWQTFDNKTFLFVFCGILQQGLHTAVQCHCKLAEIVQI